MIPIAAVLFTTALLLLATTKSDALSVRVKVVGWEAMFIREFDCSDETAEACKEHLRAEIRAVIKKAGHGVWQLSALMQNPEKLYNGWSADELLEACENEGWGEYPSGEIM